MSTKAGELQIYVENWPDWPSPDEGDFRLNWGLQLLERYTPELRFDMQEAYRADSAATITDNFTASYTNRLLDGSSATIAASDPADAAPQLSLGYLGLVYTGGRTALDTDYIDEANDDRDADAQRMHSDPTYANHVYGREIPVVDGTLLQYWFFYYNNPKQWGGPLAIGEHEGDWEMIQVRLDANRIPVGATYAQHSDAEYCAWDRIELTADARPIVYVAHESHASYFTAGDHTVVVENLPDQLDYADGLAEEDSPVVPSVVDVTSPPAWMQWPGHWGNEGGAPQAPPHQGKWEDPQALESGAVGCTAPLEPMQGSSVGPATPSAPTIEARRQGNNIMIDYRVEGRQGVTTDPWLLTTTVDAVGDGYTPTSARTLLRGSTRGRIVQPVALSRGALRVLASIRAANGARSTTIVVPVK